MRFFEKKRPEVYVHTTKFRRDKKKQGDDSGSSR